MQTKKPMKSLKVEAGVLNDLGLLVASKKCAGEDVTITSEAETALRKHLKTEWKKREDKQ